jgi:hypothetical protein
MYKEIWMVILSWKHNPWKHLGQIGDIVLKGTGFKYTYTKEEKGIFYQVSSYNVINWTRDIS